MRQSLRTGGGRVASGWVTLGPSGGVASLFLERGGGGSGGVVPRVRDGGAAPTLNWGAGCAAARVWLVRAVAARRWRAPLFRPTSFRVTATAG